MALTVVALCLFATSAAGQDYFPNFVFSENQRVHEFAAQRYSRHLRALDEPSIFAASRQSHAEMYRFLWLPSFHNPVSVRVVVRKDGTAELIARRSAGAGSRPGNSANGTKTDLSLAESKTLMKLIRKSRLWEMPSGDRGSRDRVITDGARWIYEGARDGDYRVATQQSPKRGAFRRLGEFLVRKAKVGVDVKDLY